MAISAACAQPKQQSHCDPYEPDETVPSFPIFYLPSLRRLDLGAASTGRRTCRHLSALTQLTELHVAVVAPASEAPPPQQPAVVRAFGIESLDAAARAPAASASALCTPQSNAEQPESTSNSITDTDSWLPVSRDLQVLSLRVADVCVTGTDVSAALCRLSALQTLDLSGSHLSALRACADSALPTLTTLASLSHCTDHMSNAMTVLPAHAPLAGRLTQLHLAAPRWLLPRVLTRSADTPALQGMRDLRVSGCERFPEVTKLLGLTRLDLSGSVVANGLAYVPFPPLAGLRDLRQLNLAGCTDLGEEDIEALVGTLLRLQTVGCSVCRMFSPS